MDLLAVITGLSREFGRPHYVLGGGGNTSVKDPHTLWIKPSGVSLASVQPGDFVALERAALKPLFEQNGPTDPVEREAWVKQIVMAARRPGSTGRPSVEAPLHHVFPQRFVVHTHPTWVNGMTCSRDGAAACARMFPDAVWMEYCDPGYTLSRVASAILREEAARRGRYPEVLIIQNHGIFVASDEPDHIRSLYERVMQTLRCTYEAAGVDPMAAWWGPPREDVDRRMRALLREALPADEVTAIASNVAFRPPAGPLTPDHVVYARAFAHFGPPTPNSVRAFRERWGYAPRVFATDEGVWAVGATEAEARLALEFAHDGARIEYLAQTFGGARYLTDEARRFIEGWEVEHYRRKVAMGQPIGG